MAFQLADFFFVFNSILIYNSLRRIVSSVTYLPGFSRNIKDDAAQTLLNTDKPHPKASEITDEHPLAASIADDENEDRIVIKQFSSNLLTEVEITLRPKELRKCKHKTVNPFVGYKTLDGKLRLGTESVSIWHDRHFFDSIITNELDLLTPKQK